MESTENQRRRIEIYVKAFENPTARERAVAQLGSALEWGSRGRGFESRQPESRFFPLPPSLGNRSGGLV